MNITDYHAKYFAYELTKRCASDSIEKFTASLSDAQVDLNPHQVEAALFAFISPLSKGAILADEVGLGKTIEAGIVLSQKWAERKRKILIIVPSNLRKQWSQELIDKFFLPSKILETKSFNETIKSGNLNPFEHNEILICSYQFSRTKDIYIKQVDWDLVVIDEAHRLRNVYKPNNKIANAIKNAVSHAPKLLLTATPLQNSLMELYGLVSIIDDYTFGDLKSFKSQFAKLTNEDNFDDLKERLKPICKRTLRKHVLEYIKYTNRIAITQEFFPSEDEDRLYHLVSDYLQEPNLYALPPSQRQLMTLILRKLLASSTFAISSTLDALAKKLESIVDKREKFFNPDEVIAQDFETFEEIEDEWLEDDEEQEEEKVYSPEDIDLMKEEIIKLRSFYNLANAIKRNSKGEKLLTALKSGFAETVTRGGSQKAIIFTESTKTQIYLRDILEQTEYKNKVVLFNGSNNDKKSIEIYKNWYEKYKDTNKVSGSKTADMRASLVDYFRDEAIIMIATEAAAEGINLQFCSMVVNYDLPWNPQRIEQRIGRCHRYGQKYDVVVVNFLNKKNAADQRVYELLDSKFKLFNGVFGSSDEVLGSIESGVDFEKRIIQIYQSCRTEEEIQISFDALQSEMESQIDEKINLTRQKLLDNFDEEVHEKLKLNLQQSKEYLGKYEQWLWELTKFSLSSYAEFYDENNSFKLLKNPFDNEKISLGSYRLGKNVENDNIYRISHPLSQKIIDSIKNKSLNNIFIEFKYSSSGKKISILDSLIGKSGWLNITNMTISSFEDEDYLIFSAFSDDDEILDPDQVKRLFSIEGNIIKGDDLKLSTEIKNKLNEILLVQEEEFINQNAIRNSGYFDKEIEKLDKWAEDIKNSLEIELKNLDREISSKKTESKKILKLEEKLNAQREIKELEKKRNELRRTLFQQQDDVSNKKEDLIGVIEKKIRQKIVKDELFTIRWKVV